MSYKFTFTTIGSATRVIINKGEDIRHLDELDQKMWTVMSCPIQGLEFPEESLRMMKTNSEDHLHLSEVVATSKWLCSLLHNPDSLMDATDTILLSNIANPELLATAKKVKEKLHADNQSEVSLSEVETVLSSLDIPQKPLPPCPYDEAVIKALEENAPTLKAQFEQQRLAATGLITLPPDTPTPTISEKDFLAILKTTEDWKAESAAIAQDNLDQKNAQESEYLLLRKLLIVHRDLITLLRNFLSLEDFYKRHANTQGIFQIGTLVIDQRACHLCMRVNDVNKHEQQAKESGMFLIYCTCTNHTLSTTFNIVAALTVGEVRNIVVGKNALFYDRKGNEYEAVVTKIIDNPISIGQAFWSPYRKLGNWWTDFIQKLASNKESDRLTNITSKVETKVSQANQPSANTAVPPTSSGFDIAKFAGIFAAIGLAIGSIGSMFASLLEEIKGLHGLQFVFLIVGILLIISGPSMLITAFRLRKRNLSPLLNANGWAVNSDSIINLIFGNLLTEEAQFPLIKFQDPFAKKGISTFTKISIWILIIAILVFGIWLYLNYSEVHHWLQSLF